MRFRSLLLKLDCRSPHHRYHHAAIVAKGKSIYGVGINTGLHAEAIALHSAGMRARGCTLYTLMLRRDARMGDATPCPRCMALIRGAGIQRVIVYV